jgi:transposase
MTKNIKFVGLDVHAATVAIAVAEMGGEVRSLGTVANEVGAIRRVLGKLGKKEQLRVCYEAGPTGYALYWELVRLGIECIVVAPSLIPKAASDRVKTDRRDAQKLARSHRAGDLTSVWVPDQKHEALRDLVRHREAAQEDNVRAKHRLGKFFLRYGLKDPSSKKKWSDTWWQWARNVKMPHVEQEVTLVELISEVDHQKHRLIRLEAAIDRAITEAPVRLQKVVEGLQSLRGVAKLSAVTLAVELGSMTRFQKASQVMSYTGMTSSEYSSGGKRRQGAITKAGNAHLRRVLVEAAWQYRHPPRLMQRQKKMVGKWPAPVADAAWRAQQRLHRRYRALSQRGMPVGKVVTAVARELSGFVWAIGLSVENALKNAAQQQ